MRYLRFLALGLLMLSRPASAGQRTYAYGVYDRGDPGEVLKIKAFVSERMDTLANVFGIDWPTGWFPSIQIGLPEVLDPDRQKFLLALYEPDSSTICFHPLMFNRPDSLAALQELVLGSPTAITDHELGHAFISEYSRKLTGRVWPPQNVKLKADKNLGVTLLSEGLARVIEFHARGDSTSMPDSLWEEYVSAGWVMHSGELFQTVVQNRSYRLLIPLVQRYGLAAVISYVTTHPLKIHQGHLRKAVSAWRRHAEKSLAAQWAHQLR